MLLNSCAAPAAGLLTIAPRTCALQILTRKLGEIEKKYGLGDKSKVRIGSH